MIKTLITCSIILLLSASFSKPLSNISYYYTEEVQGGSHDYLVVCVGTDHAESNWWKATFRIHMYAYVYVGIFPFGNWQRQWIYRNYDCEVPPGQTFGSTTWDLQPGEYTNTTDYTVISFVEE